MHNIAAFLFMFAIGSASLATARAEVTLPPPPTEFLAVRSLELPGAVELSWRAVKGVSEYTVSSSRETAESWHDLGTTTATRYQVDELPEGTKYYFRIASNSRAGRSAWSGAVVQYSSRTKEFRPALLLPVQFRHNRGDAIARAGQASHKGELVLTWTAVAGAKSYLVQICDSKQCGAARAESGSYSQFNRDEHFRDLTTVAGLEHLVTDLRSGQLYLFRVLGIDDRGERGSSSQVQANRAP